MVMESALLQVVLSHSNEGIHMIDTEGITRFYNEAAAVMDGLDSRDVLNKHVLQAFPSLNRDTSTLLQVSRTGKPIIDQQQIYTNIKGQEIITINTTLPVFGQGRLLGAVEVARDISRVRKLAEQVLDLRRKLDVSPPPDRARQAAKYTFDDIIGTSPDLEKVLTQASLAAHTDSPVLVTGETGTGKELLVQAIHNASLRHGSPFVAQNCAALPESLLEAILFGSTKGSFTGAQDRPWLFELAHGGTLFLDELNAMPLQLQAKLLRVLETGVLRRLGGSSRRHVDVRIITAMSEDPLGALRPDLYFRINVVRLTLPPLRERQGDIPLLCQHFLQRFNAKLGTRVTGIAPEAIQVLRTWSWPGNVRELANLLEGILNFRSTGQITWEDLPEEYRENPDGKNLRRELARVEKQMIESALRETRGNISRAAQLLAIPRPTLQRKLAKLGWHGNCYK